MPTVREPEASSPTHWAGGSLRPLWVPLLAGCCTATWLRLALMPVDPADQSTGDVGGKGAAWQRFDRRSPGSRMLARAAGARRGTQGWPSFAGATRHWSAHTPVGSWLRSQAVLSYVDEVYSLLL